MEFLIAFGILLAVLSISLWRASRMSKKQRQPPAHKMLGTDSMETAIKYFQYNIDEAGLPVKIDRTNVWWDYENTIFRFEYDDGTIKLKDYVDPHRLGWFVEEHLCEDGPEQQYIKRKANR